FGVDLWLAPALNIHRNICCGRNFEYFSEDPFLSGRMAAAITAGVEAHPGRGVTIKHVLCNNQELNRNNGDSRVSERALREIYLRGFEICIREAAPKALMTSYNLVNGTHTSESYELINDILRCELKYDGLVMSDWIASGRTFCRKAEYPAPYAHNNIKAGNDLTMPGSPADEKDIMRALKRGELSREDLLISASRVYRAIMRKIGG
ncbi:MAG: glycoside hydrolase family 3 protein, partial [Lachnospiraceae bacterium]|nr:glycoside hydrolase family 3 protein [Lachnospiraceae bacterium]